MRRILTAVLVFALLFTSTAAWSMDYYDPDREPSGGEVAFDIIFVRPLGIVATTFGAVVFIVGLPFTLPTRTVKLSAEKLVAEPFLYTFKRPVGELKNTYGR